MLGWRVKIGSVLIGHDGREMVPLLGFPELAERGYADWVPRFVVDVIQHEFGQRICRQFRMARVRTGVAGNDPFGRGGRGACRGQLLLVVDRGASAIGAYGGHLSSWSLLDLGSIGRCPGRLLKPATLVPGHDLAGLLGNLGS